MDAKYINVSAIDTLLNHNDLSDEEFLNRCTTISTPRDLAMIRKWESALVEQIEDLSQALRVAPEVLTDTTGETFEMHFLTHRFLEAIDRVDDKWLYKEVIDHNYAARNTGGEKLAIEDISRLYHHIKSTKRA